MNRPVIVWSVFIGASAWMLHAAAEKFDMKNVFAGQAAFIDGRSMKPGTFRKVTADALPPPFATSSSGNPPRLVPRPADAWPQAPAGFKVELYATNLDEPREIRTAPNGDLFVAETAPRPDQNLPRRRPATASRSRSPSSPPACNQPFGIAFYPRGTNPQWVYVGNTNAVVRFPYKNGDLQGHRPRRRRHPGPPHAVDTRPATSSSRSTARACSSPSDPAPTLTTPTQPRRIPPRQHPRIHARRQVRRRLCLRHSQSRRPGINPTTGELWCSVNERDDLGDNLVPDYITHVQHGGFYGWPWYYIGGHQDPRLDGKHPELKDKVIVPDVLLQPHNASLEMTFYDGTQFPRRISGRHLRRRARLLEPRRRAPATK